MIWYNENKNIKHHFERAIAKLIILLQKRCGYVPKPSLKTTTGVRKKWKLGIYNNFIHLIYFCFTFGDKRQRSCVDWQASQQVDSFLNSEMWLIISVPWAEEYKELFGQRHVQLKTLWKICRISPSEITWKLVLYIILTLFNRNVDKEFNEQC